MMARSITFKGKRYPTISAMARDLGMSRANIHRALRSGRLDTLGIGAEHGRAIGCQRRCQPVAAHGWHWGSQREAAEALGRSDKAISQRLNRGTFENLVLKVLGPKPEGGTE